MSLDLFLNSIYLFFIVIFILFIYYYYYNISLLNNLYTTLGGKIILLLIILFGCTINIWVGLVFLLVIIIFKPKTSKEGLSSYINSKMNLYNDEINNKVGVDPITISQAIQSKASSSLPIANTSNNEVESFDTYNSTYSQM